MKKVFFEPWVGKDYYNNRVFFKKKILILGESHYCQYDCKYRYCGDISNKQEKCRKMTEQVINEQISEDGNKFAIYTKVAKLLLDKVDIDRSDKIEFWNSVSYYNYIQESLYGPRKRPTQEMWINSEKPFKEVMNELIPDFLLILGSDLWQHMSGIEILDWEKGPLIKDESQKEQTWYYPFYSDKKEKRTLALWINHPSSYGFKYGDKPIIKKFLQLK